MNVLTDSGLKIYQQETDKRYVRQEDGKGLSSNDFTDEYKKAVDEVVSSGQIATAITEEEIAALFD
ncbi:MAG TPA: hypothetical protein IAA26_06660 [Candidatus Blautia faecipullorum]|nr:hypothetical protein [Candidatus Blautia faecipullorum]